MLISRSRTLICQRVLQTNTKSVTSKAGKLSAYEVNQVLTANEYTREFDGGPVKSFDTNQLGSNNPIEDSRSAALCNYDSSILLGVFDGHGEFM